MVSFIELGKRFDGIKDRGVKTFLSLPFEKSILQIISIFYKLFIPVYISMCIITLNTMNDYFNSLDTPAIMLAGILLFIPYMLNLIIIFMNLISKNTDELSIGELKHILKLDGDSLQIFGNSISNIVGGCVLTVLIAYTVLPLLPSGSISLASIMLIMFINVSLVIFVLSLLYIMKELLFKPIIVANTL